MNAPRRDPQRTALRDMARTLAVTLTVLSAGLVVSNGLGGALDTLGWIQLGAFVTMLVALVASWSWPLESGAVGALAFLVFTAASLAGALAIALGALTPLFLIAQVLNLGVGLQQRPPAGRAANADAPATGPRGDAASESRTGDARP